MQKLKVHFKILTITRNNEKKKLVFGSVFQHCFDKKWLVINQQEPVIKHFNNGIRSVWIQWLVEISRYWKCWWMKNNIGLYQQSRVRFVTISPQGKVTWYLMGWALHSESMGNLLTKPRQSPGGSGVVVTFCLHGLQRMSWGCVQVLCSVGRRMLLAAARRDVKVNGKLSDGVCPGRESVRGVKLMCRRFLMGTFSGCSCRSQHQACNS